MSNAEQHLVQAKECLAIAESGDAKREAYMQAAEHVAAAIDQGATQAHVATCIGKSRMEVQRLLTWRKTGYEAASPWLTDEKATHRAALSHTKKVLNEAPMEQIERIIEQLPDERKAQIGSAAGDLYMKSRADHDDKERNMTEVERKQRDAVVGDINDGLTKGMSGFTAMGIVDALEDATRRLKELISVDSVTAEAMAAIDVATVAFLDEYRVAQAMVSMEVDS